MWEKYLITFGEDAAIGLKYNYQTGVLVIGGYAKLLDMMITFVSGCVHEFVPSPKFIAANKVRFTFKKTLPQFRQIIKDIPKMDAIATRTNNLERIMR